MAKIELRITNNEGYTTEVDVLDSPFRLNRTVFTTSEDKLKTLGGVTSTNIQLAKSKRNNLLFNGKSEFDDYSKFNNGEVYKAVLVENGAELARGTFSFNEGSISWNAYEGTFYDENIDWVSELANINLNELDYVDGKPTWLVPFDGAITFNQVNDLNNNQTDFICPTIAYNNKPDTDYLDLTDEEIWGTFDYFDPDNPKRLTPAFSINDFKCNPGTFNTRLGHTFDSFPPAVNYKNLLQRIFKSVGVELDCSLFNRDWFNALYLPYVGDEYKYNWKNLATINTYSLPVNVTGEDNMDEIQEMLEDEIDLNFVDLPPLGPGNVNWIRDYKYRFVKQNIIKHDDTTNPATADKITAYNKFDLEGQYICPTDGQYKFKIDTEFTSSMPDPINIFEGPTPVWLGNSLLNNFGSWDANSQGNVYVDRHYAWDDNVLVIQRYNESDDEVYKNTSEDLYRWMNGENTDFIDNPNDVIAYFSPKRKRISDNGPTLATNQYAGSPLTDFTTDVVINGSSHTITSTSLPSACASSANIEITVDLKKNERVRVYWTRLENINGEVNFSTTIPQPYSDAFDSTTNQVTMNISNTSTLDVEYLCGEYDLDLAQNLPNITCKEFVSSFIKQFNLYADFKDNTVMLLPQKQFYSDNFYDITSRVVDKSWNSSPLPTPKVWQIGYTIDNKDRLLSNDINKCDSVDAGTINYGNLEFDNPNASSNNIISSYNMFSSTKFINSDVTLHDVTSGTGINLPQTTPDPVTGLVIYKGIQAGTQIPLGTFVDLQIPSIQSLDSFNQVRLGNLTYDYNYTPRLFYHLGTVNQYTPLDDNYQCLVDSPRQDANFILKDKHWFRPTVSQFDHENEVFTGISYPSLRYDRTVYDDGLYISYFENLIQLYNESELFKINVALRSIDWENLTGSLKVRYRDQLYRLSQIIDYDPQTNNICTLTMIKEI